MSAVLEREVAAQREVAAERERALWGLLSRVADPEIPILSIVDLGLVRHVRRDPDGSWSVGLTPTYSGCPATEAIRIAVRSTLDEAGHSDVSLEEVLSPPWTSAWLTSEGRRKLGAFGIAPPQETVSSPRHLWQAPLVPCPRCDSRATERISEFGSTACKAHYRCNACGEPFDYFKCL